MPFGKLQLHLPDIVPISHVSYLSVRQASICYGVVSRTTEDIPKSTAIRKHNYLFSKSVKL